MSRISVEGRITNLPLETQEVIREIVRELNDIRRRVQRGSGTPESRIVGYRGDIWQRTDGGTASCVYIFEGVDGALTGWVAK
jgi:hypothetical protein